MTRRTDIIGVLGYAESGNIADLLYQHRETSASDRRACSERAGKPSGACFQMLRKSIKEATTRYSNDET